MVYFDECSHAYIITNENLRGAMAYMPEKCKRALVVAASGDHPIFCSLHAALYYGTTITVDTFDITPNARAIMDVKTAAIQCLNRDEYVSLLKYIHRSDDVLNEPYMNKVSKILSDDTYKYLYSQKGNKPFGRGFFVGDGDELCLPIDSEYQKLQEIIKKPYDFVQTDIAGLSAKLEDKMYDFMHLSNVFDYIDSRDVDIWQIIYPLMEHVNVGGRILFYVLFGNAQFLSDSTKGKNKKQVCNNVLKNWRVKHERVKCISGGIVDWDRIVVFERVR